MRKSNKLNKIYIHCCRRTFALICSCFKQFYCSDDSFVKETLLFFKQWKINLRRWKAIRVKHRNEHQSTTLLYCHFHYYLTRKYNIQARKSCRQFFVFVLIFLTCSCHCRDNSDALQSVQPK